MTSKESDIKIVEKKSFNREEKDLYIKLIRGNNQYGCIRGKKIGRVGDKLKNHGCHCRTFFGMSDTAEIDFIFPLTRLKDMKKIVKNLIKEIQQKEWKEMEDEPIIFRENKNLSAKLGDNVYTSNTGVVIDDMKNEIGRIIDEEFIPYSDSDIFDSEPDLDSDLDSDLNQILRKKLKTN